MKVENRKLFSNRDARSKLANMGGIMTSSPELMGEAQRFAEGSKDAVAPSMFLVQVPGFIGGNEFLHLTSSELQLLSQSQPELMGQDGVVIQEATPEILSELNPAQLATTDNNNVKRMFADLGVDLPEAEPSAQAPVEAAGGDEGGLPFLFSDTTGVSRDGRTDAEIIAQAQALMGSNAVPAPAREGLETLGDVVEEDPRTANRQAALAKLKEQVSNFSLFPDAARREENLSRFLDGAIDTPSGAVTAFGRTGTEALPERTGIFYANDVLNRPVTELFNSNTDAQNRVSDARRRGDVAVETPSFMDSDAGQSITPEMAQELKVLEQAREAQEFAGGVGGLAKAAGAGLLEGANIAGGVLGSGTAGIGARMADALGYTAGYFPSVSKPLFRASDSLDEFKKNYYGNLVGQENYFPRMYTPPKGRFSEAELLAQDAAARRARIQAESEAAIENADSSVFAEGEPVEQLDPDNLPDFARTISNIPPEVLRGVGQSYPPRVSDAETLLPTSEQRVDPPPMDGRINSVRGSMFAPLLSPQSLSDDMAPAEELMALRAQEAVAAADRRISGPEPEAQTPEETVVATPTGTETLAITPEEIAAQADGSVVTSDNSLDFSPMEKTMGDILGPVSNFVLGTERTEFLTKELKEQRRNKIAADSTIRMSEQGSNFVPPADVVDAATVEPKVDAATVEPKVDAATVKPKVVLETEKKAPPSQSSVYEGYKQEIQDVLGKGNKTIAGKEKWEDFSLAMFRIAAGKDPNAVTNIAAGLAQAAVDKKTSRSVQQDRDDKINLLALKMAGDDRIAKLSYDRAIDVANISASARKTGGVLPNRATAVMTMLETMSKGLKYAAMPIEEQMVIANSLVDALPEYGGAGETTTSTADPATSTYTIGQRANDKTHGLIEYTKDGWRKVKGE